ncbi:hypothetical protein [Microbacterium sp.]|uniref:hypothetical protein n=1 Tax=Microbacterium sp. TaxID=51671 RepID=UPI0039E5560F
MTDIITERATAKDRIFAVALFAALYVALTVWILIGADLVGDGAFRLVKNLGYAAIVAEVLASAASPLGGVLFVAIGRLVAPLVEELVFREIPFGRLRHRLPT